MADLTKWDVVVVGGANTDYLVRGKRMPHPGETIQGETFQTSVGGKGSNQAVAASRMGARVAFVGRVGNDARGDQIIEGLDREGVDTSFISCTDRGPTGVALVMVDEKGEKQILTAPGANHDMRLEDVDRAAKAIRSAKVLLVQLEIPLKVVQAVLKVGSESSGIAILDPAPAQSLKPELLRRVDIIRPNSGEARVLTGIECHDRALARRAALALLAKGVGAAIVQAGKEGPRPSKFIEGRQCSVRSGAHDQFEGDQLRAEVGTWCGRRRDSVLHLPFGGAGSAGDGRSERRHGWSDLRIRTRYRFRRAAVLRFSVK
jgi:ribokinase